MNKIKLIILDVDGTMTTGEIAYLEDGQEIKIFNAKDGLATKLAVKEGLKIAIITGRTSPITIKRGQELGVQYLYQNIADKIPKLLEICEDMRITPEEVCYIGDDVNDLSAMKLCGYTACPKDAAVDILSEVDFVSSFDGGKGAIREVIETIMKHQGIWPV
jgi:3-deoxy-D-manno-octulosonate 8-phosphate phosphatase (KDO 8-P phosphatase)